MGRLTTYLAALAFSWGLANTGCGTFDRAGPDLDIAEVAQPVTWSYNMFGIHDTKTHESGSGLTSHASQWNQGDNFAAHLSQSATKWFDYDLVGKEPYWRDTGVAGTGDAAAKSLESVDLFFTHTHGGADNYDAIWAMWDAGEFSESGDMRLGDDNRRLSVFASASCHVLQWDTHTVTRWEPVFMGTLRIALGSHGTFTCSEDEFWTGSKFADRLHEGWSIKAAWHSGMGWTENDEDSAVLVTGTNETHCFDRLDHMSWYNLQTYKRLGDAAAGAEDIINYWCISRVDNG